MKNINGFEVTSDMTYLQLSKKYNVSKGTVAAVISHIIWKE